MKNTSLALLMGLALLLSACGGSPPAIPSLEVAPIVKPVPVVPPVVILPTRPVGSPDYFVVGVSGKCFSDSTGIWLSCANLLPSSIQSITTQSTKNNYDYLTPRETLLEITSVIKSRGYSFAPFGYAASLIDRLNSSSGKLETQYGFTSFERDIGIIYQRYIKGFSNPSKIVIVAHSHGVVWSHLFENKHPEVPIEIQVDFDGVCLDWVGDNWGDIADQGYNINIDKGNICDGLAILKGGSYYDIQNRILNNVKYNVEIQSEGISLRDSINNHRDDGSYDGIYSIKISKSTHSSVTMPNTPGLNFAAQTIMNLLPPK